MRKTSHGHEGVSSSTRVEGTSATSADLNAEDKDGCGWRRGSRDPGQPATRTACDPSVLAGRRQAAPGARLSHRGVRLCSN